MHMLSWKNDQNYAVLSKQKHKPCFNLKSLRLNPRRRRNFLQALINRVAYLIHNGTYESFF